MCKGLVAWFVVVLSVGVLVAEEPLANAGRKGLEATSIDEMLALPDEEIDIGKAALLIGREQSPNLRIRKYLRRLDEMAREVRARVGGERDARKVVTALTHYIFAERHYTYISIEKSNTAWLLHSLLDRKRGNCLGLSTLYLALLERLGVPCSGVALTSQAGRGGHQFVRYRAAGRWVNLEATTGGPRADSDYLTQYPVPNTDAARSFFMRNLTKKQYVGMLLTHLGDLFRRRHQLREAEQVCSRAAEINAKDPRTWTRLGEIQRDQKKWSEAAEAYSRSVAIDPSDPGSWHNLGRVYRHAGRLDESVEAYKKSLEIAPEEGEVHFGLAITYLYKEDYAAAWEQVDKMQELGYEVDPRLLRRLPPRKKESPQ